MRESAEAKREYDRLRRAAGPDKPLDPATRDGLFRRFKAYRRLLHPQPGSPDTFIAVPRRWLCIDLDKVQLPAGLDVTDRDAVIAYIRSLLPPELRDVTFVLQLSSSAGFVRGRISCHLWFWLAEPAGTDRLKCWAAGLGKVLPVDPAAFEAVQPIYIANPVCGDGVDDPLRDRRVILVEGTCDVATLPPDDLAPKPVRRPLQGADSLAEVEPRDGIPPRPNGGGDERPHWVRTSGAGGAASPGAPDLDLAEKVVRSISNDGVFFPHHMDVVRMAAAVRGAFADDVTRGEAAFLEWGFRYDGNMEEYLEERWRSVQERHELGWDYLVRKAQEQEHWREQIRDGRFRDEEEERRLKEWAAIDNRTGPCPVGDGVTELFDASPAEDEAGLGLDQLPHWPAEQIRARAGEIAAAVLSGELSAATFTHVFVCWSLLLGEDFVPEAFGLISAELFRLGGGNGQAKP